MRRVLDLFREWLQIRTRVWEEHRFHLEQAEADWLALGLSRREACRAARRRFGARQSRREALRELGGNLPGLAHLFNAHQVSASAWLQPIALIAGAALLLVVSPDSRAVLEGIAGQPLTPNERAAVFISVQAPNRSYRGISSADFELMRSIPGLAGVQRYRAIHVRADIRPGFTVGAIQSRVRGITANAQIRVIPMFEQASLVIGPAKALWACIGLLMLLLLAARLLKMRWAWHWFLYGLFFLALHSLTSMISWAIAMQAWSRVPWRTDGAAVLAFLGVLFVYVGAVTIQCWCWWRDLHQRCPICLEGLRLPLTEGTADRVLLTPVSTESVCIHGHGVLVENRWSRRFWPQESPLERLVRA